MLSDERQRAILETLDRDGRVLVVDLAKHFQTSTVTIRKDLRILHAKGRIHRTHGGALRVLEDSALQENKKPHRKEKLRIAEVAARMIREGQVVILDSGSITAAIARALRNLRKLTIITNAVNIAMELSRFNLDVILTGGKLRKNSFSLVGPMAEDTLRRLSADVFFLGVDGFDVEYGLTTPNLMEAKVNRTMIDGAKLVVAVCDSSRFGKRSLCLIDRPTAIRHVITDRGIPKADLDALKQSGIEVTVT
jgi:DeoR family transcriptional regulator of aga operon